jgi:predicted ATPase
MGLRHAGGRPLDEALAAYVKHVIAAPTLLLLDNFERLLEAAPSVARLLEASTYLKVLTTSRSALHVYGEHEFPVFPLDVPGPECGLAVIERNPAVGLFVQRARSADPAFELKDSNAPIVADLCRRLDGLPLAIELAAAQVKLFSVESMLPRLDNSLDFLAGGPRDVPARQQTLRKTVDWSHDLLTRPEQRLFHRVAVLIGGFTLESAQAVCDSNCDLGLDVVTGIASLLGKNLVYPAGIVGGEARFNMLDSLRKYALEQLAAGTDEASARRAHAAYCMVVAEEGALQQTAAEHEAWLRLCDAERDNFRSALDWLVSSRNVDWALRLSVALYRYWEFRELLEEGRQRLQTVVKLARGSKPTVTWARAVGCAANLCCTQGDWPSAEVLHLQALDAFRSLRERRGEAAQLNALGCGYRFGGNYAEARAYGEATVQLCRELGERAELAGALSNLAGVLSLQGHRHEARAMLDEARGIFENLEDHLLVTWSVNHLGDVARHAGDLADARRLYQASLDGFARHGDPGGIARASADLANVLGALQDFEAAGRMYAQALNVFEALDHKRGIARVFEGFAVLAHQQQQYPRALTMAGAAAALRDACGSAPRPAEQATLDESLAPAWQSLERAGAQAAWDAGRRMSLGEAIRVALAD